MPIESATYIHQLETANPAGTDPRADGDNHIRLIKQVLKATFPNVQGAVSANQFALGAGVPTGGIVMWSGTLGSIPAGWALCDGSTYARLDGGGNVVSPNLVDKFVLGAGVSGGTTVALGDTGGDAFLTGTAKSAGSHAHSGTTATAGAHSHGGVTDYHWLTTSDIPPHQHALSIQAVLGGVTNPGVGPYLMLVSGGGSPAGLSTGNDGGSGNGHRHFIGSDGTHSHTFTTGAAGAHTHVVEIEDGRPPFLALYFIIRL
jgi:hypothetical protein